MPLTHWLPPIAWMGVIFWLSTGTFSAERTGGWVIPLLHAVLPWATPAQIEFLHWFGRKSAHVTEYAILAWLWYRALAGGHAQPRPRAAFVLTVAYAILDELHQGWTGQRGGNALDVLLDSASGAAALALRTLGWRGAVERLTALLLWVAAGGGSLALVLTLAAGVPIRWLAASVPLAWLALWAWRRQRRVRSPK